LPSGGASPRGTLPVITLRQIEALRAIMITGGVAGAAKLLNVSAPGVSRLMKYTGRSLNLNLFDRRNGRYVPTPEAQDIFEQINGVYKMVDDLQFVPARMDRGAGVECISRARLHRAGAPSAGAAPVDRRRRDRPSSPDRHRSQHSLRPDHVRHLPPPEPERRLDHSGKVRRDRAPW
jgi:hypothetical protein